ncbi:MAG: hypothetical protein KGH55_03315 [Nanoarchaeota archaeon]|nr:hypothetical protein [Nanoarchaeota archaeon]
MEQRVETVSLRQFSDRDKIFLLNELGFQTDGKFVLDEKGEVLKDKYIGVPVTLKNMLIFPGSTVILDDNEISITLYINEYGDKF